MYLTLRATHEKTNKINNLALTDTQVTPVTWFLGVSKKYPRPVVCRNLQR